jgi:hypothetical protein
LGIWEEIYNPNFNRMEFHTIKNADGRLVLTPKRWVERTNAIGIFSKSGRYGGGIFAHRDIAFEFGSWLSAEFKFYLIKEFQRLKEEENNQKSLEWNLQRTLSKINYRIHTDAICLNRDFHKIIMIALIIPILLIIKILKIRVQTTTRSDMQVREWTEICLFQNIMLKLPDKKVLESFYEKGTQSIK